MKASLLAIGCVAALTTHAQSGASGFFNPLSATRDGVHLYGATVYGGYFSGGSTFGLPTTGAAQFLSGPMTATGASANFGWSHGDGDRSTFNMSYTPSYIAYPTQSELNSLNHSFFLNWNRKIGQKWTFTTNATGVVANLQQTYFSPNAFAVAASLPTRYEDLAAAILSGKLTDAQLAATLTGISARVMPEQTYLYGRRIGSAALQAGIDYAPSGRTSVHVSVAGIRAQGLSSGAIKGANTLLIPQTTAGSAVLGWRYSITPRTNIGIDVGTSRTFSRLQDGYASTANFSIGRTMSQHWFVQVRGGAGRMTYLRNTTSASQQVQYLAGGSLGYKVQSHTLLGSYDRSLADSYGLGATSTASSAAGWSWKRPGSLWSLSANFGYQQLYGSKVLVNSESWRASGGIGRALGRQWLLSVQYAYFTLPSSAMGTAIMGPESGVTVAISWTPSQYR